MDEEALEASLAEFREQKAQMDVAMAVTTEEATRGELATLRDEIAQMIKLTEESLLSLKKSKLLSQLETSEQNEPSGSSSSQFDSEFAAFQAALAGDVTDSPKTSAKDSSETDRNEENKMSSMSDEVEDDLDDITGVKCRVPFNTDWGPIIYQNAMVLSAEPITTDAELQVRVLFCNPTRTSMLPCPYFLDDKCKFSGEDCKYSHGYLVNASDLGEFKEADHSLLQLGTKCLAKYKDGLWYEGKVVDLEEDHRYTVMFDSYDDETFTVDAENIIPAEEDGGSGSDVSEDDNNGPDSTQVSDDEENSTPVFLWRPQTTDKMGEWEQYTKGIGSKLMLKMGYIIGQGLGKDGSGRAEPVPIQLLPQGKTLDKIMELKERAGDKDLYDVMKKKQKRQRKADKSMANQYCVKKSKEQINVFDFINKKLKGKKGDLHQLTRGVTHGKKQERSEIKEKDLHTRSDRHLNIQLLKTEEEIKTAQKEISKLKSTLSRHNESKAVSTKVNEKIASLEAYIKQLKQSSSSISRHKQKRTDHKKLTIF